ncbi:MAG TPA: PIG-L deacetylase family protein [SAR202 cluster bacterium]|jgi:LmbE family N-acetylglucosaminyl deacetylase|nr:PIG-L deacetylase family protein [SAR202 cluster bacterium]HJO83917.1 PIG-L deacetylase family protein [SAR202 cluster bacterium]
MVHADPKRTLLAVFAHPDDEAFGSGGMLALNAAKGHCVALVTATRGEVGEISDTALATPENLGQVREGELRAAADALGVEDLTILGYRDSGMDGTDDNANPTALANADENEVVGSLVEIIRRLRPDAVVTFDPNAGTVTRTTSLSTSTRSPRSTLRVTPPSSTVRMSLGRQAVCTTPCSRSRSSRRFGKH